MISIQRKVNIPKFLWNLHGKQAYKSDLIFTYLLAIIVLVFNILTIQNLESWKIILIGVLSLDIGGGVVSNFTKSTINYYKESGLSPHLFIWFHGIQLLVMVMVYSEFYFPVLVILGGAMVGSSIVIFSRNTVFQFQLSVFLFALVVLQMALYPELPIPLKSLVGLMSFKLMVAFAGNYGKRLI